MLNIPQYGSPINERIVHIDSRRRGPQGMEILHHQMISKSVTKGSLGSPYMLRGSLAINKRKRSGFSHPDICSTLVIGETSLSNC